jgi:serine/threonine protein kinase
MRCVVGAASSQKSEKYIYLVLEYCAGGDLSKFIQAAGPFPEPVCRHFLRQLGASRALVTPTVLHTSS